jgi:quinohemoprotein ethanol dehydrogenase
MMSRAMAGQTEGAGANWPGHSGAADESGYSQLNEINSGNIRRLGLAYSLDLPGEVTLAATPVAVDGVLYFTGSQAAVYAVEAATGKLLWKRDPQTWKYDPAKILNFAVNRGVAYADGRVFAAAMDGRLFALDAKSGTVLWSVQTLRPKTYESITGAPRVFEGKVIIGNGGADFGARGYVTAYEQATGKQIWRFYTAPGTPEENKGDPAMEKAAATWSGEYWKVGTGGAVWNAITFDPELHRVYLGTGNAGPWDPELRSPGHGDNLYTASIVALESATGKYAWHYQINPRDSWDYDCTQQMTLAELLIGGKPRKVLMQAPKNGFFYVLDRENGKLISAGRFAKANWAKRIDVNTGRPVEEKNVHLETGEMLIWPSGIGAHNWHDMSFNPVTGLVYIPAMQLPNRFLKNKVTAGDISMFDVTVQGLALDPKDGKGSLIAWDPIEQKARWQLWYDFLWNGGTLSTAGGLVFQGTADGYFSAYDAASGKQLWRFNASHGIVGGPVSYSVAGRQYISVLAGFGGAVGPWGHLANAGWKFGAPRRLLTFTLDGKAVLPLTAPRDMAVHALDDPALKLDENEVRAGGVLFMPCGSCHGLHLEATGSPAPDLRESGAALDPDVMWGIVHNGERLERGMPRLETLTREQVHQIWSYIRDGARKAIAAESKPTP